MEWGLLHRFENSARRIFVAKHRKLDVAIPAVADN
jgi:hypothetical protein